MSGLTGSLIKVLRRRVTIEIGKGFNIDSCGDSKRK
jgi:hypothetical protein